MGVKELQVYDAVYEKTKRKQKVFSQNLLGYYEQEAVYPVNFKKQLDQKTPQHTLQNKKEVADKIDNEIEMNGEYGIEEYA